MPTVTVLVAVHNGEPYLAEALDSLLAQSYHDFELLVVDDGSTDGSTARLEAYARSDSRIRLLRHERNQGLSASLNHGLAEARGQYIARQDADDRSAPHRLARQVARLESEPTLALVGTGYRQIDEEGLVLGAPSLPCDGNALRWALNFYCPFVHSAVMFRRAIVPETIGPYNEQYRYAMDYELWARIADRYPVANLPEPLVDWRYHPRSMTVSRVPGFDEAQRLRTARAAQALQWPGDPAGPALRQRFDAMVRLIQSAMTFQAAADLEQAVSDVDRLAAQFSRTWGLDPIAAQAFQGRVQRQLAAQLVELLSLYRSEYTAAEQTRLLTRALRYDPAHVWSRWGPPRLWRKLTATRAPIADGPAPQGL